MTKDCLNQLVLGLTLVCHNQLESDNADTYQRPGYVVTNLMVAYRVKVGHSKITLQLNVDNRLERT